MNRSLFDFNPPIWLPTKDKEVLERCRNIRREDMECAAEFQGNVCGYCSNKLFYF